MLLIDDYQSETLKGQEESRACTKHDPGPAMRRFAPCPAPFLLRKTRMPGRRCSAKALGEAPKYRLRQRYLRQQDKYLRLRIPAQRFGDAVAQ